MGIGGISVGSLLIILVIVLLLFGTKKLRNVGTDLGGAIKGFRSAMKEGEKGEQDDDASVDGSEANLEDKSGETETREKSAKTRDQSTS